MTTSMVWGSCLALGVSLAAVGPIRLAAQTPDPCTLVTPAEIESATGLKVTGLTKSPAGPLCMGQAGAATVMLRIAKSSGAAGREAKGAEQIKKMGGQVDVKSSGAVTCSSFDPPPAMAAQVGFNTTCSVTKDKTVAAIEITVKEKKDAIPIDKLRPLAEKMATRF